MALDTESRPLPELIGGLASDISTLFRKEIELAKTETSEKVSQLTNGLVLLGAGGVLALGALGVILAAIVTALAAFFVGQGMGATAANSLAAAIVGVIVAIIAWVFISRGLNGLKASNLKLDRTTTALGRDAAAIREKM
jgi:hypothetical protein